MLNASGLLISAKLVNNLLKLLLKGSGFWEHFAQETFSII